MRLRRNTFAAAIRSASEIVRCFAAAAGHLSEEDRSLRCLALAAQKLPVPAYGHQSFGSFGL
jgi:hypothetical protein